MGKPSKDYAVPLWEKANLTVYEAAAYSGIGADKLRELSDRESQTVVIGILKPNENEGGNRYDQAGKR